MRQTWKESENQVTVVIRYFTAVKAAP